jgi:hypothetical protein
MDLRWRSAFNSAFTPALYRDYVADLERRTGIPVGFRLAETPVFIPAEFRARCESAAGEIVAQLGEPARLQQMEHAVPQRWRVPNRSALPTFATLDFAAARLADGSLVPRLVELQGFPSLIAFETLQADAWMAALAGIPSLDGSWTNRFGNRERDAFLALARATILGNHGPDDVVLLDLDPATQKTSCDFAATASLFGVAALDPRALTLRDRRLYRRDGSGRERRVRRIYDRLIVDELERSGATLPFDLRDEIDVEWTPHPDWFWIWSKYSLAFLDHPAVPRTTLLSELDAIPPDLERRFVLKPLFSFAGGGVNVRPTASDLRAIPAAARSQWCLQERIDYGCGFATPDGDDVKVEIRLMFLRPDDAAQFTLGLNLCRLARGELHGVDFNRDLAWTGSSVGLWRTDLV